MAQCMDRALGRTEIDAEIPDIEDVVCRSCGRRDFPMGPSRILWVSLPPMGFRGSLENKGFARIRERRDFPSHWQQVFFQTKMSIRGGRKTSSKQGISSQYQAPDGGGGDGFSRFRQPRHL
jgi:hypothetical protein